MKELDLVLKQCQIKYKTISEWTNLTYLRKDILKEIETLGSKIDQDEAGDEY